MTTDIEKLLSEAMIRADVYRWHDHITGTECFKSMNTEEPLTNEEKELIVGYFVIHLPGCKVEFKD